MGLNTRPRGSTLRSNLQRGIAWAVLWGGLGLSGSSSLEAVDFEECLRDLPNVFNHEWTVRSASQVVENLPAGCTSKDLINIARRKLSPADFEEFERLYRSFFFFNPHEVVYANSMKDRQGVSEPTLFNRQGEYPLDGYFAARRVAHVDDFLSMQRALLSRDSITPQHVAQMQIPGQPPVTPVNSEQTSDSDLGVFRSNCSGWRVDPQRFASSNSAEHTFQSFVGIPLRDTPVFPVMMSQAVHNNKYLNYAPIEEEGAPLRHYVTYPCLDTLSGVDHVINSLGTNMPPELLAKIQQLREKYRATPDSQYALHKEFLAQSAPLHHELVQVLMNQAYQNVQHRLRNLDPVRDRNRIIDEVASFSREMVSIHPFVNGSGRTTRLVTERLLEDRGINPPVYNEFEEDVLVSEPTFQALFRDSIRLSDHLIAGACANFKGADSLNIGGVLGLPNVKVGLKQYADWVQKQKVGLASDPSRIVHGSQTRAQVEGLVRTFHAQATQSRFNFASYREALIETPADTRAVALGREIRLIDTLARPFTAAKKLFSWQSQGNINHYTTQGQTAADLQQQIDSYASRNRAGNGIYTDMSASGSSIYGSLDTDLLVVDVPQNERVVDLKDPQVLGRLHENGIFARDVYYLNVGHPVKFHNTGDWDSNWLVYKRALEPQNFHRASVQDFKPEELTRLKVRMQTPVARAKIDQLIRQAKESYEQNLERNSSAKDLFWTPFGDCYSKVRAGKFRSNPVAICEKSLGASLAYDEEAQRCLQVTPENVVYGTVPRDSCPAKSALPVNGRSALAREYVLPSSVSRTPEEMELLQRDNLELIYADPLKTKVKAYNVIAKNQYLNPFRKTFTDEKAALAYLKTVPHPLNLGRYAERILRSQGFFTAGLDRVLGKMCAQAPRAIPCVSSSNGVGQSPELLAQAIKKSLFTSLPDNPRKNDIFDPPSALAKRTIDVTLNHGSELHDLLGQLAKGIPGFVLQEQEDKLHPERGTIPVNHEGDRLNEGATIIRGFQDGIPIAIRVRYQESVPAGYRGLGKTLNREKFQSESALNETRKSSQTTVMPSIAQGAADAARLRQDKMITQAKLRGTLLELPPPPPERNTEALVQHYKDTRKLQDEVVTIQDSPYAKLVARQKELNQKLEDLANKSGVTVALKRKYLQHELAGVQSSLDKRYDQALKAGTFQKLTQAQNLKSEEQRIRMSQAPLPPARPVPPVDPRASIKSTLPLSPYQQLLTDKKTKEAQLEALSQTLTDRVRNIVQRQRLKNDIQLIEVQIRNYDEHPESK